MNPIASPTSLKAVPCRAAFLWIAAGALMPLTEVRGENCVERCAVALGSDDPVSMTIYENCLNTCRNGSPGQGSSSRYAALAFSKSNQGVGASHGQNSEADAKQTALSNCRRNAASDCELLNWGDNLCFALAVSRPDGGYGQAFDANRAPAAAKALALCRGTGAKNCAVQVTPCAGDDPRWSSPLPLPVPQSGSAGNVDPRTIGTWELSINPGVWVWEIGAHGTYEFHSLAADGAASHAGTFSAADGHWSLQATTGYSDSGTYQFQSADVLIATGRLGTGIWRRARQAGR